MYDEYLDELLEEAYLEGYYDSIDDYDDYYMERRSNINPSYDDSDLELATNDNAYLSKFYPHEKEIFNKLADKYKDEDTLERYRKAHEKLAANKDIAYSARKHKDIEYLKNKGASDVYANVRRQEHRRPLDMDKYDAKAEKGKANLEKFHKEQEKEKLKQKRRMSRRGKIGIGVGAGAAVGGSIGYGLYKYNKKKKAMINALKDPKFRDEHPELVKKYKRQLAKEGIKLESGYYDAYLY